MSRNNPNAYAVPLTPVTPVWAAAQNSGGNARSRLLPSAIEMTTPPQSIQRKFPDVKMETSSQGLAVNAHHGNMHVMPSHMAQDPRELDPAGSSDMYNSQSMAPMPHFAPMVPGVRPTSYPMVDPMGVPSVNMMPEQPKGNSRERSKSTPGKIVKQKKVTPRKSNPMPLYPLQTTGGMMMGSPSGTQEMQPPLTLPMEVPVSRTSSTDAHAGSHVGPYSDTLSSSASTLSAGESGNGISSSPATSDIYTAYNNYILRQATEDKSKVVWSPEVEAAFMEALWLIPCDSRKILVEQRGRGRNELIADYLQLKLNEVRTRKQVSSHLQVLKKLLINDAEFLRIVGPKKENDKNGEQGDSRSRAGAPPETAVTTIQQLIDNMRVAKQHEPKPQFLLQAEANLQESRKQHRNSASMGSTPAMPPRSVHSQSFDGSQSSVAPQPGFSTQASEAPHGDPQRSVPHNSMNTHPEFYQHQHPPSGYNSTSQYGPGYGFRQPHSAHNAVQPPSQSHENSASAMHYQQHPSNFPSFDHSHQFGPAVPHYDQSHIPHLQGHKVLDNEPPLKHPRPVHAQDMDPNDIEQHIIPPSVSVPPQDMCINVTASPRRGHNHHHHHRSTSRSIDFGGDQLVPTQFIMTRKPSEDLPNSFTYTRLIRAAYSSPSREIPVESLLSKYPELEKMYNEQQLEDVKIVQATASLHVKPAKGSYASHVQYAIASDQPNPLQHRYMVRTVITSRHKDLLRCEMPCMFQALTGRPFEQDQELINVPFLSDFWSDFLARLNDSSPEYTQAALSALNVFQAVYRIGSDGEKLCFIGLYQFNSVPDEFSARTRFTKVRGVSNNKMAPMPSLSDSFPQHTTAPHFLVNNSNGADGNTSSISGSNTRETPDEGSNNDTTMSIKEPATPTRSGTNNQLTLGENTPRPLSTPSLFGLGTPGLGAFLNCESPGIFASPRRLNHMDHMDFNGFSYPINMNNESRGSPRSSKFEIQRAMSAFEPSGWDDMQEWIYR